MLWPTHAFVPFLNIFTHFYIHLHYRGYNHSYPLTHLCNQTLCAQAYPNYPFAQLKLLFPVTDIYNTSVSQSVICLHWYYHLSQPHTTQWHPGVHTSSSNSCVQMIAIWTIARPLPLVYFWTIALSSLHYCAGSYAFAHMHSPEAILHPSSRS